MLWLGLAVASPMCEPPRPRALRLHVRQLVEQFEAGDRSGMERSAEALRRMLPCLDRPVTPDLIGMLAWIEVARALERYRPREAWSWGRLASDLGVESPLPLDVGRMESEGMLRMDEAALPWSFTEGLRVYVDGVRVTEPRAREGVLHFVQVFDGRELVEARWQYGARFSGRWLAFGEAFPRLPRRAGTEAFWTTWLAENPSSPWRSYAEEQLDTLRFVQALEAGGAGLESYLERGGTHFASLARQLLEPMELDRARMKEAREDLAAIAERRPPGRYARDAEAALDALDWELATEQDTASAYATYLERQPLGRWAIEAAHRHAARALVRAERLGEMEPLREVVERLPGTVEAEQARALLEGMTLAGVRVEGDAVEPFVMRARALGLRVERGLRGDARSTGLGALRVRIDAGAAGVSGVVELWLPDGRAPLERWQVEALDEPTVTEGLLEGMRAVERWVSGGDERAPASP